MKTNDNEFGYNVWGWLPLLTLLFAVIICGRFLAPWVFMWLLSFAIYFGLKWLTWWQVRSRVRHSSWRSAAYLLAWPGMDANIFLSSNEPVAPPATFDWLEAAFKTIAGGVLLWAVAWRIPPQYALIRGWVGMVGLILLLHFGSFQILALAW